MADPKLVPAYCESLAVWAMRYDVCRTLWLCVIQLVLDDMPLEEIWHIHRQPAPFNHVTFRATVDKALENDRFEPLKEDAARLDDGLEKAVLTRGTTRLSKPGHSRCLRRPFT